MGIFYGMIVQYTKRRYIYDVSNSEETLEETVEETVALTSSLKFTVDTDLEAGRPARVIAGGSTSLRRQVFSQQMWRSVKIEQVIGGAEILITHQIPVTQVNISCKWECVIPATPGITCFNTTAVLLQMRTVKTSIHIFSQQTPQPHDERSDPEKNAIMQRDRNRDRHKEWSAKYRHRQQLTQQARRDALDERKRKPTRKRR